jgi:hypothetical protein
MFGMFGASFGQGMQEQGETMERSRRDLANAFETFKRNNPYATYNDYQSFIDMYAGNNNYLRGGMPGGEVIQALAQQGAERKQRDLMAEQLKEARSRAELQGSLEALIDRQLLSMGGEDYDKAYNDFATQFGGPNAFPGMNVRSMFSPERRNRLQTMEARKYMDDAVKMAQASNGEIDPAEIARTYGISPDIAKRVSEDAKRRYADEKRKEFVQVQSTLIDKLAANPEGGDSYLKAYEPFLTDEQKVTFKREVDAKREKMKRDEDEKKEALRVEVRGKIEDGIASNPDMRAAILRSPNREGGIAAIRDYMKRRIPAHQQAAITDEDVAQLYNSIASGIDNTRDNEIKQRESKINEVSIKAQEEAKEQSLASAKLRFGREKNYSASQQSAADFLAKSIDMTDPATQDIVDQVMKEKGKDAPMNDIVAAVRSHPSFSNTARSITDFAQRRGEAVKLNEGLFDGKVTGFSNWIETSRGEIGVKMQKMEKDFIEKVAGETDPFKRSEMLKLWTVRTGEALNAMRSRIEARGRYAERWTKTGDGWRDQEANELLQQIDAYEKSFAEMASREVPRDRQVQPNTPAQYRGFYPTTAPQPPAGQTAATPIGRGISGANDQMAVVSRIGKAIAPFEGSQKLGGIFMRQSPQQMADAQLVTNFVENSNKLTDFFTQYPDELAMFERDPVGYIKSRQARR